MGRQYVSGKYALGICDRCGWAFSINDLKDETYHGVRRGVLVCRSCWDTDHPQLFVDRVDAADAQSIRNPSPDTDRAATQALFGWDPVGEVRPLTLLIGSVS